MNPSEAEGLAPAVEVSYLPEEGRFVGTIEGSDEVAFIEVQPGPTEWVFGYTQVPGAWQGKGVGMALVRGAVAQVRAMGGLRIRPECPFVAAFFRRYPEEADLLRGGGS